MNQKHEDFLFIILLDPELRHLTDPLFPKNQDKRIIHCYQDRPVLRRLLEYDEVVMALIDCDDMYSRDAGTIIMDCPSEWMYFKYGYAYDPTRNRMWNYDTIGTGPFWIRRRNPREIKRFEREKRYPGHKSVIHYDPKELAENHFCVLLHELNTSSSATMRNVLGLRPDSDWQILKKEFGQ